MFSNCVHVCDMLVIAAVYELCFRRFRWYSLKAKAGSKKADQNRGELEVTAAFLVQQNISQSQSSLDIEKKTKKSLSVRNLAHTFSKGMLVACFVLMFTLPRLTELCDCYCLYVILPVSLSFC